MIACLTLVLVGATIAYVKSTGKLAQEAKRTDDMAARNLERTLLMTAPSLVITDGPYAENIDETRLRLRVSVLNGGDSTATEIEAVIADWPAISFEVAVPPRSTLPVALVVYMARMTDRSGERRDLGESTNPPKLEEFRFTDPNGTRYRQPVGGRTVVLGP